MNWNVYTLWASMKGEDPSPWMVAAEDEGSWEGDPDRCEHVFQTARELCDRSGWDYREVTITVPWDEVSALFEAGSIEATVEATK